MASDYPFRRIVGVDADQAQVQVLRQQHAGVPGPAERGVHQDRAGLVQGRPEEREHTVKEDRPVTASRCAHRSPF